MKCNELIGALKGLAPEGCAHEQDSPRLLAGRSDREVKKVYVALDVTSRVVEAAIEAGAHMSLTHHPLIFRAIKRVNDQNFIIRRLVKSIQSDISYYAMHTNFDTVPGYMADLVARRLGLKECVLLGLLGEMDTSQRPAPYGTGRIGILRRTITVRQVVKRVKEASGLPFALVYGQELMDIETTRISLCPGAEGGEIEEAVPCDSQVPVTGDINHHQGVDAAARQVVVINAGHYELEHISIPYMAEYLEVRPDGELEIIQVPPAWPAVIVQRRQDQVYSRSCPDIRIYGGILSNKGGETFGAG